ncbi:sensor histidine kinase [Paenibacillus aquistagni]|uniref:histidine kinase n=1 Tax=Paenibacillus aquistagni TaxID=1852522 RepID=A0A1X7I9M6_9BACL|nr:HAMP domain-containing sensor histidine kinase [Paenibacillus aquistagni]SMG10893.1 Signal transduction histidine kinase [Paenibacillus aquistagni]
MSIQKRLVGSYLAVILITVGLLEIILIAAVNHYYHHNVQQSLIKQAEISASFFNNYFAEEELSKQSDRLLRGFAQNTSAQVQIIDASLTLLEDSNGNEDQPSMTQYPDIAAAMAGKPGIWRGKDISWGPSADTLLAVSYPLQAAGSIVGVVRYVTSLAPVIATIQYIASWAVGAGLFILILVAILGIYLSRTITEPILALTAAASQLAEGDLTIRTSKRYQDELGTLSDTFNTMAARLEQHQELKNDFISSISHEIRTPLTNIHGWVVTLKADPSKDEGLWREGLDIIDEESIRLTQLVEELLDFSKLENGRIQLSLSTVDVPKLLRHIEAQLTPRAERLGLHFEVTAAATLPAALLDENRMKQVLINLLDNAFKFTRAGGTVILSAAARNDALLLTISDNGQGIPSSELPYITEKFYHGKMSASGSGLGLSICQEIMKLHQGSITIDSVWEQGTTVRLKLPIKGPASYL